MRSLMGEQRRFSQGASDICACLARGTNQSCGPLQPGLDPPPPPVCFLLPALLSFTPALTLACFQCFHAAVWSRFLFAANAGTSAPQGGALPTKLALTQPRTLFNLQVLVFDPPPPDFCLSSPLCGPGKLARRRRARGTEGTPPPRDSRPLRRPPHDTPEVPARAARATWERRPSTPASCWRPRSC